MRPRFLLDENIERTVQNYFSKSEFQREFNNKNVSIDVGWVEQ